MGIVDVVSVLSEMPTLLKLKKGMVPRPATVADCFGARVEANANKFGHRSAIVFESSPRLLTPSLRALLVVYFNVEQRFAIACAIASISKS